MERTTTLKTSVSALAALLLAASPAFAFRPADDARFDLPAGPPSAPRAAAAPAAAAGRFVARFAAPDAAAVAAFQATTRRGFQVVREPDTGNVRLLTDGRSRAYTGTPEQAARAFLSDARPLFGPGGDASALGAPVVARHDWGSQVSFPQELNGLPVIGGLVTVNLNTAGEVFMAENAAVALPPVNVMPALSARDAVASARGRIVLPPALAVRPGGLEPRLVWQFTEEDNSRIPVRTMVDAHDGRVVQRDPLVRFATGSGLLYRANPTRTPARDILPLTFLNGDGTLTGDYTKIYLIRFTNGVFTPVQTAVNAGLAFNYPPDSEEVSQAQAYYGISGIHDWFKKTFAFTGRDHQVPGFVRDVGLANAYFQSANSVSGFSTPNGFMDFGYGATGANPTRDFAQDTDVLYHEYGHAVMDVLSPAFADAYGATNAETGGMNEGNADYFSSTVLDDPVLGEYAAAATGDAYYRDLTARLHYPEEVYYTGAVTTDGVTVDNVRKAPEVHQTGAIWGAALWDLRTLLGTRKTDQIVFKATSLFTGTSNFQTALSALLVADDMLYSGADKAVIRDVFQKRGIMESAYPVSYVPYDAFYAASGPSKLQLGIPYTQNGYAYIRAISPLPSYNVGEPYFVVGYLYDAAVQTVALVLKDANDAVVARITSPVRSFNAYGNNGVYYNFRYFWQVGTFPADLIPAGQSRRAGLRLYFQSYAESKATVDAGFDTLTPRAAAPAAGQGYAAELIVPGTTPPVFSPSLGDTDGNGRIQMNDALLVVRAMTGKAALTAAQKERADVAAPQGGSPDMADARVILQRAGGLL